VIILTRFLIILSAITQTLILPEISIVTWIKIVQVPSFIAFLIVFFLGNLFISVLFFRNDIKKILPKKIQTKILGLTEVKDSITFKTNQYFESLGKTEKYSIMFGIMTLVGFLVVTFFSIKFIIGVIIFVITFIILSNWLKNGGREYISKKGYIGIVIGAAMPLIPGFRQSAVLAVAVVDSTNAKLVFFGAEAVRMIVEIIIVTNFF